MEGVKKELTIDVLEELLRSGYLYFLSKPGIENNDIFEISLLPVNYNPEHKDLPVGFDGWYNIKEEGYEMACGVETIRFTVLEPYEK